MRKPAAWNLGIVGLALLVVGLVSVTAPNMTVPTLMLYFGVMLLIIGGVQAALCLILRNKLKSWKAVLVVSVVFGALGFYMIKNANTTADRFTFIMGIWALLIGAVQLFLSISNKGTRIFLISMGIISLFFGGLILLNPFSGANTMTFMVGFYTLMLSFFLLYLSLRLFRGKKAVGKVAA